MKYRIYFNGFEYYPQYSLKIFKWTFWRNFVGGYSDSNISFLHLYEAEAYIQKQIEKRKKAQSAGVIKYFEA